MKGLGRGHVKRIKDQVRAKREQILLNISAKKGNRDEGVSSADLGLLKNGCTLAVED